MEKSPIEPYWARTRFADDVPAEYVLPLVETALKLCKNTGSATKTYP